MFGPDVLLVLGSFGLLGAPSNADSGKFAGVWEGVFHGGKGDQPVALVCRPRGAASIAGMFYMNGLEFSPIEEARVRGDSLTFRSMNFRLSGQLAGDKIALRLAIPHGLSHDFTVQRVSADTMDVPPSVKAAAATRPKSAPRETVPDSVYAAHAVPHAVPSSALPCLARGTLLLVGGGPTQADINSRFVQLAGGTAARIVVIPTASLNSTDPTVAQEQEPRMAQILGVPNVVVLHTLSRKEADSEAFVQPLRNSSGVWITGGEAEWILSSYFGTRTERELIALLDRGGVIGGTSAGALVWGSQTLVFRAEPDGNTYRLSKLEDLLIGDPRDPCIGVLRNVLLVPHFTEFHMQPAVEKTLAVDHGLLAFGIDESTALEVHGEVCTVLGRGHVTVFDGTDPGGHSRSALSAGARYDLHKRVAL